MCFAEIATSLEEYARLGTIDAHTVNGWAKQIGTRLATARVSPGYFLNIVTKIDRIFGECRNAVARQTLLNCDELFFIEPHIGYQAARKRGDEQAVLRGFRRVYEQMLQLLSSPEQQQELVEDLRRLNQFFQAIAAYYRS